MVLHRPIETDAVTGNLEYYLQMPWEGDYLSKWDPSGLTVTERLRRCRLGWSDRHLQDDLAAFVGSTR